MVKDIEVLPHQEEFVESLSPSTGLVAGFGAGKSYAGTLKTIIRKLQYPSVRVAYYLPTHPHIRDIAFEKFPEMLNALGIAFKLNKSDKVLKIKGYSSIIFRNMTNPEFIIGYDVGYSLIDECDILVKNTMDKAFKQILARNRAILPDGTQNQLDVVGTPEGYRWFHSRFVTNSSDRYRLIKAKTTDNPFLPSDYVDTLREAYDEKMLKQYLDGEFVNVNGSAVYHQFDRALHVVEDRPIDTTKPLIMTWDFNINPYNAVFFIQVINGVVYVVDNGIKSNSSVVDTLVHIKEKFSYLGSYLYTATIYGDATGRARSQGTAQTNYDLIKEAGFSKLKIKTANPRVTDRVNVFNSTLKNGKGKIGLKVCEKNKELITDLEQMAYDDKGIIDKSNQELSHASDSVGYYVEFEHRIVKMKEIRLSYA